MKNSKLFDLLGINDVIVTGGANGKGIETCYEAS